MCGLDVMWSKHHWSASLVDTSDLKLPVLSLNTHLGEMIVRCTKVLLSL